MDFLLLFPPLNSMDFNVTDDTIVNSTLQLTFKKLPLAFWCQIKKTIPQLCPESTEILLPFPVVQLYEFTFFPLIYCNKTEHRKTAETDMRTCCLLLSLTLKQIYISVDVHVSFFSVWFVWFWKSRFFFSMWWAYSSELINTF